ncbi:MAG: hypothetical protein ACFFCS_30060 [Candidatus Hodarchaeota archaeon]
MNMTFNILQNGGMDAPEILSLSINIGLLGFLIAYTIVMFYLGKKSQIESQKEMYRGFGLFVITLVAASLLSTINRADVFPKLIRIGGTGFEYLLIICFALGFIFLMKPIEKHILNKEKLRFTKLNIVTFILVLIPYICSAIYHEGSWIDNWTMLAVPGLCFFLVSMIISIFGSFSFYIRLGIRSTGIVRTRSLLIGIGIIFMYAGLILNALDLGLGEYVKALLGTTVMIIGAIMVIRGYLMKIQ